MLTTKEIREWITRHQEAGTLVGEVSEGSEDELIALLNADGMHILVTKCLQSVVDIEDPTINAVRLALYTGLLLGQRAAEEQELEKMGGRG